MHAKPLKRYRQPHYPTRLEVLRDPDLLKQHIPPAWRTAEMAGAVAVLLAINGCTKQELTSLSKSETPPQAAAVVPIFEHGTGRGATGCIVVAPPVFLSEEEALQVITEQFRQAGVDVARTNTALPAVNIRQGKETKPLEADGVTADGKVAFEFVSRSDYFNFGGLRSGSTVQDYDLLSTAKSLAQQVAQKGKGIYFGAFYDPMRTVDLRDDMRLADHAKWQERAPAMREESKRLLREQVTDFIGWLKGQGVI